ncbi:MAG: helix-turn-helix domain-containing protein, partial [Firmicutes bacterium]|nr:helix-turn-helix domain-containing protein [Bacillota bacterium]
MALGEKLRTARKEKGLTLTEVETETKNRQKYILALEHEEFDVLPGKVYVKGFMRTYARFLGLDGDALVKEFEELS